MQQSYHVRGHTLPGRIDDWQDFEEIAGARAVSLDIPAISILKTADFLSVSPSASIAIISGDTLGFPNGAIRKRMFFRAREYGLRACSRATAALFLLNSDVQPVRDIWIQLANETDNEDLIETLKVHWHQGSLAAYGERVELDDYVPPAIQLAMEW